MNGLKQNLSLVTRAACYLKEFCDKCVNHTAIKAKWALKRLTFSYIKCASLRKKCHSYDFSNNYILSIHISVMFLFMTEELACLTSEYRYTSFLQHKEKARSLSSLTHDNVNFIF